MRRLLVSSSLILMAFSAEAAPKVTNLDSIPHVVAYESAGSITTQTVNPNQSVYFAGQPEGTMSLVTPHQKVKPNRGTLHADGILSGIVGTERTQEIPVDRDDTLTIWPGGELMIQQRREYRNAFH